MLILRGLALDDSRDIFPFIPFWILLIIDQYNNSEQNNLLNLEKYFLSPDPSDLWMNFNR